MFPPGESDRAPGRWPVAVTLHGFCYLNVAGCRASCVACAAALAGSVDKNGGGSRGLIFCNASITVEICELACSRRAAPNTAPGTRKVIGTRFPSSTMFAPPVLSPPLWSPLQVSNIRALVLVGLDPPPLALGPIFLRVLPAMR